MPLMLHFLYFLFVIFIIHGCSVPMSEDRTLEQNPYLHGPYYHSPNTPNPPFEPSRIPTSHNNNNTTDTNSPPPTPQEESSSREPSDPALNRKPSNTVNTNNSPQNTLSNRDYPTPASSRFPIALEIESTFSPQEQDYIAQAMRQWEDSLQLDFFAPTSSFSRTPEGADPYIGRRDGKNRIYKITLYENWSYYGRGSRSVMQRALGIAMIFSCISLPCREISETDIAMNQIEGYFDYSVEGVLFHHVMLHELGHVLGLPHSENRMSVMYVGERRIINATVSSQDTTDLLAALGGQGHTISAALLALSNEKEDDSYNHLDDNSPYNNDHHHSDNDESAHNVHVVVIE